MDDGNNTFWLEKHNKNGYFAELTQLLHFGYRVKLYIAS